MSLSFCAITQYYVADRNRQDFLLMTVVVGPLLIIFSSKVTHAPLQGNFLKLCVDERVPLQELEKKPLGNKKGSIC